jgi:flagellar export protein FliJ
MAFKYRYARILELRHEEEEMCKNTLGLYMSQKNSLLDRIAQLKDEQRHYFIEKMQRLTKGIKATELPWFKMNESFYKEREKELNHTLHQVELEIIKSRLALVKAMQERKKFEKLKERAKIIFDTKEEQSERALVDQIVTYKATLKQKEHL